MPTSSCRPARRSRQAGSRPRDERRGLAAMHPVLRLFEDTLSDGANLALPALPRMIFIVHGAAMIDGEACGAAWHGEGAAVLVGGREGVTCWRWEFAEASDGRGDGVATGPGVASREKISARLENLPAGELLLRG